MDLTLKKLRKEIKIVEKVDIPVRNKRFLFFRNYLIYYQFKRIKFFDLELQQVVFIYNFKGCKNFAALGENKVAFINIKGDYMHVLDFNEQFVYTYDLQEFEGEPIKKLYDQVGVNENVIVGFNGIYLYIIDVLKKQKIKKLIDVCLIRQLYLNCKIMKLNEDHVIINHNPICQNLIMIIDWKLGQVTTVINKQFVLLNPVTGKIMKNNKYTTRENSKIVFSTSVSLINMDIDLFSMLYYKTDSEFFQPLYQNIIFDLLSGEIVDLDRKIILQSVKIDYQCVKKSFAYNSYLMVIEPNGKHLFKININNYLKLCKIKEKTI